MWDAIQDWRLRTGKKNASGLVFAGGMHLFEASLERGLLLRRGQFRQQQGMADADMFLIERGGGVIAQLGQLRGGVVIYAGVLPTLAAICSTVKVGSFNSRSRFIALGLFHRVHVPALEEFSTSCASNASASISSLG